MVINIKEIKLLTHHPLAYESPDHLNPLGTMKDNSKNWYFNYKFYELYKKISEKQQLKILDLGCSGGGFVKDCIDGGCFAMGLEGSDFSKKMKRAEWRTIPEHLFTADITKEFSIQTKKNKKIIKFHLITCWEVLEHLTETSVNTLIENIKKHLLKEGIFIASIANNSSKQNGVELHQTQRDKKWWVNKFKKAGLKYQENLENYFSGQYIRGGKETKTNFHIIFSLKESKVPLAPTKTLKTKIKDFIYVSNSYNHLTRFLKVGVCD
jgi:2-polyprenyl-3-methyl-5-hydroxy-6-metoxy-1,4-benzoquinol methylase